MKKLIGVFLAGVAVGFALALFVYKEDMPLYTSHEMMDEAREHFDGSTDSIQQGRKNLLP